MLKNRFLMIIAGFLIAAAANGQGNLIKQKVKNLPNYDYAPYHFGFVLAINQMHFTIDPIDNLHEKTFLSSEAEDVLPAPEEIRVLGIDYKPEYGFTVGIVGNLRLGKYTDLRFIPSLAFGERVINYNIAEYRGGEVDTSLMKKRIPSTYIDFPLTVKYKSERYNNVRAYVVGGAKYSLDLASLSDKQDDSGNKEIVKLKRHDFSFEIGVGFDYYLNFFKLGTEITMSYSPFAIAEREGNMYTGAIEKLQSKYFQLSFTFE
ncbi:MAG: PorT family protein [Bacteroidales bacterium]|nr:PorT family protein [Bacteroidales bacterium]MCF8334362.1 PorT family protein [Bacteroidales bacterium]